ncbi:hypothetical protein TWF730_006284 [Orbilia blumenaviensis]|uniref:Gfd2/YDR514C-like C-terminal domain-containing protein n=1 Tax=Orbilia blumenaviensis TaxID=1796055 RepID=A0AAV9VG75_9PEZI
MQNVVLVALDSENPLQIIKSDSLETVNSQIGFAILDTKDLLADATSSASTISTYNFVTGTSKYHNKVSRRFLFGKSSKAEDEPTLAKKIKYIIPGSRNIVLIGHDINADLRALIHIDPRYKRYETLDTQEIASQILPLINNDKGQKYSLHRLLTHFKCPFYNLHCAGNDANFTLRLLLLLAVSSVKDGVLSGSEQNEGSLSTSRKELVKKLKEVARAPVPLPKHCPLSIHLVRKKKRDERRRLVGLEEPDWLANVYMERAERIFEKKKRLCV